MMNNKKTNDLSRVMFTLLEKEVARFLGTQTPDGQKIANFIPAARQYNAPPRQEVDENPPCRGFLNAEIQGRGEFPGAEKDDRFRRNSIAQRRLQDTVQQEIAMISAAQEKTAAQPISIGWAAAVG
jgi:hypothetical protein